MVDMTEQQQARERGFTMIEIGIVMVILVIVMAIAIPTFFGAKKTAELSDVVSVARSYAIGVEAYKLDHAGQAPALGSANWPTAAEGPINAMPGLPAAKRRYMRSAPPELVTSGAVTLSSDEGAGAKKHLQYVVDPNGSGYSFVVTVGTERCTVGTERAGIKACA